jgi:FtsP/CotA-like multicopper oxidase with cupredoxin domain
MRRFLGSNARFVVGVAAIFSAAGCSSKAVDAVALPAELPDDSALVTITDENADPNVVEVHLEARPAKKTYGTAPTTDVWSYNGLVPGPLIDAKVGDRVVVHFKNKLPESTTVHWHGVRVSGAMDGTMATQAPIAPGASFDYEFTLKDAGLFWFHPHVRTDVQVHRGLYGAIRVRDAREPVVDQEKILVLDDLKLKADGSLAEYLDDASKMLGRGGDTLLVYGNVGATLWLRPRATVRLRIVNVANGRFFNLHIPGTTFHVIGTDGGLVPHPYDTERLLLGPGERYDAIVRIAGEAGASVDLLDEPYDRGHNSGANPTVKVATLSIAGTSVETPAPLPTVVGVIDRLPATAPSLPMVLNEKTLPSGDLTFTINDASFPNVPTINVPLGELRILDITNASEMDHPFHLHGFFFQVLSRNGVAEPAAALANKDTIIVPMKSEMKIIARFDTSGMWVYHCHILEHEEGGMMGMIQVP